MEALILIDPAFLPELSDQILYELDILSDPQGKTELVYDFPEEHNAGPYNDRYKRLINRRTKL